MKPDIDLENPIVKQAIKYYRNKVVKALEVSQKVESAVIPIFHVPKFRNKMVQIASGVLVKIKEEYFVFSASHVFDNMRQYQLLVSDGTGGAVQSIAGDRFSSIKGKSGTHSDDPIDASVFHIQSSISTTLKQYAIALDDFDLFPPESNKSIYIVAGFRAKKAKVRGNTVRSEREGFPSMEITNQQYSQLGIDSKYHIALAGEDQILLNGKWETSPTLRGFSGGAIIRVDGISIHKEDSDTSKQLLTGIFIEQRKEKNNEIGVLIGTKIGVHLGLIDKFIPELTADLWAH